QNKISYMISQTVVMELMYVLLRVYKFPKEEVTKDLMHFMMIPLVHVIDNGDTIRALSLYREHNIKFGDCMIVTQIPENMPLITYDSDFKKINGLKVFTPAEFLLALK